MARKIQFGSRRTPAPAAGNTATLLLVSVSLRFSGEIFGLSTRHSLSSINRPKSLKTNHRDAFYPSLPVRGVAGPLDEGKLIAL
jgi:hypothetical protein